MFKKMCGLLGVLLVAGCCGLPVDELQLNAAGNTRDLRLVQDLVVPKLPAAMQDEWTENLATFIVRSQVMEAALAGEEKPDQAALEAAELTRARVARGEEPGG